MTMVRLRLRTKFILSLVFTIIALTCAILFTLQIYLRKHARQEIYEGLYNSVVTFQRFDTQRQRTLAQSAGVLADLPNLKALMTTRHELTIQDASTDFWQSAGSDLFLLADRTGRVMALHTSMPGFDRESAQSSLARTLRKQQNRDWWFGGGHLYQVFLQPIYFGSPGDNLLLGVLAMGVEVDNRLAALVARIASSEVAFRYGKVIVVSTLLPNQQDELARYQSSMTAGTRLQSEDFMLGGEHFLGTSLELAPAGAKPVSLTVLKSYDAATIFLQNLNRLLLGLGLIAVIAGSWLIFLISHTFTRPLAALVSGVHALGQGDFSYPLNVRTQDELGEVTLAFDNMRKTLEKNQRDLLHAERLATIGRMASSISHDLRHPLTAILAYAEFLGESNLDVEERKDLYEEIHSAVNKMAEQIASLLEFSKAQEALQRSFGDVTGTLRHTINTLQLRSDFSKITITLEHEGSTAGWFDFKKLDRAFYNLLQNACEAVSAANGQVKVTACGANSHIKITVSDNGPGIPASITDEIFHPFVTYGKEGGTGLGLAVVQKIIRDHGGEVKVESSDNGGTTFCLTLPVAPSA